MLFRSHSLTHTSQTRNCRSGWSGRLMHIAHRILQGLDEGRGDEPRGDTQQLSKPAAHDRDGSGALPSLPSSTWLHTIINAMSTFLYEYSLTHGRIPVTRVQGARKERDTRPVLLLFCLTCTVLLYTVQYYCTVRTVSK